MAPETTILDRFNDSVPLAPPESFKPDPQAPIAIEQSPAYWQAIINVMMEAPVAGRIVSPLIFPIAEALRARGHNA